jgi:C4-dicarboxylate-specific signal transduction histidine kinase
MQNAKLATLGELTSSITHEINSPLTSIIGFADMCKKNFSNSEKVLTYINNIERAGLRLSKIVNSMRKYSRSSRIEGRSKINLTDIVSETLEIANFKAKMHSTRISMESEPSVFAYCDEVEMGQVVMNLVSNAIDAIKTLESRWVKIEVKYDGDSAEIRVRDSGNGIPQEIAANLFTPFFTT